MDVALLLDNHHKLVGTRLAPDGLTAEQARRWLYEDAPFGVLAHDASADPVFRYANKTAQRAFEYDWAEFTSLPSRLSAGPQDQAERQALLEGVARDGFVTGYRGLEPARRRRLRRPGCRLPHVHSRVARLAAMPVQNSGISPRSTSYWSR